MNQNKINVGMSMAVHFVVGYDKTVQFWLLEFSSFRRTRRYSTRPSTFIRKHRTVSTLLTVHFYRSSIFHEPFFGSVNFKRSFQVIISLNFAPVLVMDCHVNLLRRFLKLPNKLKQMDFDLKMFYFWE